MGSTYQSGTNGTAAATLDGLLAHTASLRQTKQAETAMSEPGSQDGPTTHPVKNVDDQLHETPEGAQSQDNTKKVKEEQGPPSVDSTPDKKAEQRRRNVFDMFREFNSKSASNLTAKGSTKAPGSGSAADDHYNIGLKVEATGEDPANETDATKPGKDDPGSTHPARTDNDSLDGSKWSSDKYYVDDNTPLSKVAQLLAEVGESLVLDIDYHAKQAAASKPMRTSQEAGQVGWEMAGDDAQAKQAVDNMLADELAQYLNYWENQAVKVAAYLNGVQQSTQQNDMNATLDLVATRQKAAMGGGGEMSPEALAGMVGGEQGGGAGAMPPEGQISPEDLEAMLGGGAGSAGAGGDMGGGGMGGDDAEVAQLLQALEQEGISPEQAMELMNQVEGGGMPPGGGGEMPPGGEPKMGSDKEANTQVTKYIREIIERSKRR